MSIETVRDVMQVCLGGHVITDVLASHPEQGLAHCDRCGAPTISRCPTCGDEIPGAAPLAGLMPIGRRPAPAHCPGCGAAFPWAERPVAAPAPETLSILEMLLRRLPLAIRQLRDRHDGRPTLRVEDEYDLEDLLRAVLHLHFDDVRRESRTPGYSPTVRTDFVVGPERVAVTVKVVRSTGNEKALVREIREDIAYYQRQPEYGGLALLIYDPEQTIGDPRRMEIALDAADSLSVCCVVAV
jgi:hypothetical protein